eukprot:scaffold45527_cov56-Phaeocystis_antarctica.AAC.3
MHAAVMDGSDVALATSSTSKAAPPKVAYHPNVRCRRSRGCTCGEGPVIVGPMYRVGEVCVCEGAASEEEKAKGPVEPAMVLNYWGVPDYPVEGYDLRGFEEADIQRLRADGTLDLEGAILCGVDLRKANLQRAILRGAQLYGAKPPKVAYHPNVRCRRGDGCTCGAGPVIVGPMYRVGEVCVCEGAARAEEKASGPVEPAKEYERGPLVEGFDLRDWEAADIQGLRGADGTLDLEGAIMCGVNLWQAELQGAILRGAQLQRAMLMVARLQGADLCGAQLLGVCLQGAHLQGANLFRAHLQGANLCEAQLQGAVLARAQLQGAVLCEAQLQGAELSYADLSVLPKGFLIPKWGSAGETEATKDDQPTDLTKANLSVLPKGSNHHDGRGVKVSDAARPANLTEAKASGAVFKYAHLMGANLTGIQLSGAQLDGASLKRAQLRGANLQDAQLQGGNFTGARLEWALFSKAASLKETTFSPVEPPQRPASGEGAWRAKAFLGGVARAVVAAADDDDDDDSSDSDKGSDDDDGEEEESPVEVKVEKFLDAFMSRLDTASKTFVLKVAEVVDVVEVQLKISLLNSGQVIADADSILAELLCKGLKKAPKDKQVAVISETLSKHVVSPLFEQHLPHVLDEALSDLVPPTEAGAAERKMLQPLLQQLLKAFKQRALGAGKAALVKRLTPIVSKLAETGFSIPEDPAMLDEEEALLRPDSTLSSASCLVQELWKALRASLEAQARRPYSSHFLQHRPLLPLITPHHPGDLVYCDRLCTGERSHSLLC